MKNQKKIAMKEINSKILSWRMNECHLSNKDWFLYISFICNLYILLYIIYMIEKIKIFNQHLYEFPFKIGKCNAPDPFR